MSRHCACYAAGSCEPELRCCVSFAVRAPYIWQIALQAAAELRGHVLDEAPVAELRGMHAQEREKLLELGRQRVAAEQQSTRQQMQTLEAHADEVSNGLLLTRELRPLSKAAEILCTC